MARAKQNKLYRTFVKGLITEAGYLTYPEDASYDEVNTILSRKGNRTRRRGIDYEDGFQYINFGILDQHAVMEYVWKSVGKDGGLNFVCIQTGQYIHFLSLEQDPVSDSYRPFYIDLAAYKIPTASISDVTNNPVQFSSGDGMLFVVHPFCDPFLVEFKPEINNIAPIRIVIQIRDFEGVYDGLANDEEPSSLTDEHHYNLLNQGWLSPGSSTTSGGSTGGSTSGTGTYYNPWTGTEDIYEKTGTSLSDVTP